MNGRYLSSFPINGTILDIFECECSYQIAFDNRSSAHASIECPVCGATIDNRKGLLERVPKVGDVVTYIPDLGNQPYLVTGISECGKFIDCAVPGKDRYTREGCPIGRFEVIGTTYEHYFPGDVVRRYTDHKYEYMVIGCMEGKADVTPVLWPDGADKPTYRSMEVRQFWACF